MRSPSGHMYDRAGGGGGGGHVHVHACDYLYMAHNIYAWLFPDSGKKLSDMLGRIELVYI